jgi:hypothetical protein
VKSLDSPRFSTLYYASFPKCQRSKKILYEANEADEKTQKHWILESAEYPKDI